MNSLEQRVARIEARNAKVESDKAWETSWVRRGLITLLTYIVIVIFLLVIDKDQPFINAIVPCLGFILSTLTVSWVKNIWTTRRLNNK